MRTRFTSLRCITIHRIAILLCIFSCGSIHKTFAQPSTDDVNPHAKTQSDPPRGTVTSGTFNRSDIYPGTTRDYRVYVPAQYNSQTPANLMVFMDGLNYAREKGNFRVPHVLDDLIHRGEIPVTVAVFVNPGTIPPVQPGAKPRSNRSFEYDSMSDRYVRFLVDEFLPTALKGIEVSTDPADRAVCGISSGGICAWTAAWERPDQFGKVLSHIGSFTNIRGGWAYPGLIRKTQGDPKPIKVYLQEGKDDLNNVHGSWPLANHDMSAALRFAGYQSKLVITEGGHTSKYGGVELPNALRWLWDENAKSDEVVNRETNPQWQPHQDAVVHDDIPQGNLFKMPAWESTIFPNTTRDWWIYVPEQYDESKPAALMVFQDGKRLSNREGRWRIPTVFDNLIAKGDMPPTIGVFIDPGHHLSKPRFKNKSSNRGFEYDSLGDRYARFLTEEILPEVESRYNITKDPKGRAIGGSSSGAICAFTVAWQRPDLFSKVYSSVGSFTNLRGGNAYPAIVRKTEPKPIRVYMADTSGDIDNRFGSWPWANQRMAASLQYMGYDARFDWAEGYAHNADYGSSRFPDAMKWLWRDAEHTPSTDTSDDLRGDVTLLNLLIPSETWEVVVDGIGFADAPCADDDGNFYFSDMREPAIYRINASDGTQDKIAAEAVSGLEFGPNGTLYGCQGRKKRVIAINLGNGNVDVVAENVTPNDLAVTDDGYILITETKAKQVTRINPKTGERTVMDTGITRPNGIVLSPDGGTLVVSDHGGQHAWMMRVGAEGTLDSKMPTITLRLPIDPKGDFPFNEPPPYVDASRGDGSAVDSAGRYYITSAVGVQIFDATGRMCGVLPAPNPNKPLTSCVLAGPDHEHLYVTNGDAIYRRKLTIRRPTR
ncbi:alpha/beta hydrolase-fold protein [Rhodopirellula sallentina]|uniref:Hydrolase n=1 Tax=Rhodopirellula sallentina SM41 TaxID=1263870 RepID=M5UDA6_9BACT|nr:alpha/beta hydrolase-fold protein [Rhodopirellula sallentina]EMI53993.1 hydrolase [Rhodopirellula sallentina SM41]